MFTYVCPRIIETITSEFLLRRRLQSHIADSTYVAPWWVAGLGFESFLLPVRHPGIFVVSTTPQLTELCNRFPGYGQLWKYYVSELFSRCNCCEAQFSPEKLRWCLIEHVYQGQKSVKRFERSQGQDNTMLNKIIPISPRR